MRGHLSKKDKVEKFDEVEAERRAFADFAWHTVNGHEPDAVETFTDRDGEGQHEIRLYGSTRPDGGLFVYIYKHPINQKHHVECKRFEAWLAWADALPYDGYGFNAAWKEAANKLRAARNRWLAAHYGTEG